MFVILKHIKSLVTQDIFIYYIHKMYILLLLFVNLMM